MPYKYANWLSHVESIIHNSSFTYLCSDERKHYIYVLYVYYYFLLQTVLLCIPVLPHFMCLHVVGKLTNPFFKALTISL